MQIKHKLAKSSFWMIVAAIVNNFSTLAVFVVLARVLSPQEFGIVTFALIFIDFSRILVIGGIPEALVQKSSWDDEVASTAFWTHIFSSLFGCALIISIASIIGKGSYGVQFADVLIVLSSLIVIEGLSAVHLAKLRRDFKHKVIATRLITTNLLSGGIGIILAYSGWGVWSLVVSRILSSSLSSIILWHSSEWRPKLSYSLKHLKSIWSFSKHMLGSQFLAQANSQAAGLVIGAFIGPAALAQFRVGTRALTMIVSLVISPLQSTAMSAFSRLSVKDGSLPNGYLRLTRTCSLLACPVFFGTGAVAPDFTKLVFGPQWQIGGWVMAVFALNVGPAVILYFLVPALSAANKGHFAFLSTAGMFIGNLAAALISVGFGPVAVAAGCVARAHLGLPFSLRLLSRSLDLKSLDLIRNVLPSYLAGLFMGCSLLILQRTALSDLSSIVRMAVCVAVGPVAYFGFLFLFSRSFLVDNWNELRPLLAGLKVW